MRYTATITSASLRLRESRIIADLLLKKVTSDQWKEETIERNVLQLGSVASIRRVARLIRSRLECMDEGLWLMIRDGDQGIATQATFAAAVKNSRLLGDFMDICIREQKTLFATKLEHRMWNEYIAGCRGRDTEMPHWSDATIDKLRSSVFTMLAEAGYLKDTKSLLLQRVFIDSQLAAYLTNHGETYVLRCIEVAE